MKVFISYSHDSPEHVDRVLELSDRLREDGIDCRIDQYEQSPLEGWPQWMVNRVQEAGFVLVVCTQTYNLRFQGKEPKGKGKGAKWEGAIITQDLYEAEGKNRKFIPVLFHPDDSAHIPLILRGPTHYDLTTEEGYELLYRHITKQPRVPKPKLGKVKPMPPQERKQDFRAALWHVPYDPNPFFTGRESVLEELQKTLEAKGRAALTGLGGVGKTQTVLEYACRHRAEYEAVLWAKARSREALLSDFAEIARVLNLPAKDLEDQSLVVAAVKRGLEDSADWLLVLDNADDLGPAREFMPAGGSGHVLVTTRAQATGRLARVEIPKMEPEEGALFLLRRANIIPEDAPLDKATDADRAKAIEISKEMDGLPLGLDQAGAFIDETPSTPAEYLELYRTRGEELRARMSDLEMDYLYSVATTWSLSFEKVEAASPAAADLLRLCAFLAPDAIPEEILTEGADELGGDLGPAANDPLKLTEALREAGRFSLIRRSPTGKTLDIHRLVQIVLKDGMDEETRRLWAERAVRAVNQAFPDPEFEKWPVCDRVLPHAQVAAKVVQEWGFGFVEAARLLNQVGYYLYQRAQYAEAEPLLKRSLALYEKALGPHHPDVATSLHNLALLYHDQGKYAEAEPLYERSLAIREKALGSDHPYVAASLGNLGRLYHNQGEYAEAEPLFRRSLAIGEKALGSGHPHVATSLHNLAELYRAQGKYAEAEPLLKRSLAIGEKALGSDHPEVAASLNNLAALYHEQGRYAEAEPLLKRSLAIDEKALGSDHRDVATVLENYAVLLLDTNRETEAAKMEARARRIRRKREAKSAASSQQPVGKPES